MAADNYAKSFSPPLESPVRVTDIHEAFNKQIPLYTQDGVHRVHLVRKYRGYELLDVVLRRVDDITDGRASNAEKMQSYMPDGRLRGWEGTHHETIVAEAASIAYRAEYPHGSQPDVVRERDTYLREVMYPRISEHEMD